MSDINPSDYPPGTLIHHHPDHKYHQAPGISSSQVKTFALKSPAHYQYHYLQEHERRKETDALFLGTAVHCAVLEPDRFERDYQQELDPESIPGLMKTVPSLKQYCEKHQLDKGGIKQELIDRILKHNPEAPILDVLLERQRQKKSVRIIKRDTLDKVRRMRDSVHANPEGHILFSHGDAEVSVWGQHEATGQLIKCRADWLRADGICSDLKTCACASPMQFSKDMANYGYDLQQVHYTTTLTSAGQHCSAFCFIAVESEPPYLCQVYELDRRSIQLATLRYEKAMKDLEGCRTFDQWPGYTDTLSILSLPTWHLKQLEKLA